MDQSYETALPASTGIVLTKPCIAIPPSGFELADQTNHQSLKDFVPTVISRATRNPITPSPKGQ
jgi:hypothetical protein